MATAESRRRGGQDGPGGRPADISMTWQDREDFRLAISRTFPSSEAATHVLAPLRVPETRLPAWGGATTAEDWWTLVFQEFDRGIISTPYRRLLASALERYGSHAIFLDLSDRYLTSQEDAPAPEAAAEDSAGAAAPLTCHVVVRASDEAEREHAAQVLGEAGLSPRVVFSTEHATSFSVSSADVAAVRRALDNTGLGWTVVPPGHPDYLLRELFVQGPDGSRFRFTDAPSAQTVGNVAAEVIEQYHDTDTTMPTVADQVRADGERRRLDMDETLHESGIRDGDSLRVGFEARAGAVNTIDQQDALDRVYHQITGCARAHPGMTVRTNRVSRPTEYEIDFRQDSFGPPAVEGSEPHIIDRHRLLVQLGPEFPVTPPSVFWLTPIFHPNVFPNYDSDQSRGNPDLRGLVCLGLLAESWHPAADFGEIVQMLVAVAGYRNYDLFQATGEATGDSGADGPQVRANFFDRTAAMWAWTHQSEIVGRIGGAPVVPHAPAEPGYPNVIGRLDGDARA